MDHEESAEFRGYIFILGVFGGRGKLYHLSCQVGAEISIGIPATQSLFKKRKRLDIERQMVFLFAEESRGANLPQVFWLFAIRCGQPVKWRGAQKVLGSQETRKGSVFL